MLVAHRYLLDLFGSEQILILFALEPQLQVQILNDNVLLVVL